MGTVTTADDVLGLNAALEALALIEPRQAQMVESRFFGGLDVAETAQLLDVSEATVLRDWRAAKAAQARNPAAIMNASRWSGYRPFFISPPICRSRSGTRT